VDGHEISKVHAAEVLDFSLGLTEYNDFLVFVLLQVLLDVGHLVVKVRSDNGLSPQLSGQLGLIVAYQVKHDRVLHALRGYLLNKFRDRG